MQRQQMDGCWLRQAPPNGQGVFWVNDESHIWSAPKSDRAHGRCALANWVFHQSMPSRNFDSGRTTFFLLKPWLTGQRGNGIGLNF